MANKGIGFDALGEVYAQALVNEAQKQNAIGDVTDDIQGIGELMAKQPTFAAFVQSPTIDVDKHVASLEKIFQGRIHPLTLALLKSMARRERLMILEGVLKGFAKILRRAAGAVDVELTSATTLSPESQERIRAAVSKAVGMNADMTSKVDAKLIGGMMLRIEDTLMDGSVATQLEKVKAQIRSGGLSKLQKSQATFTT